MAAYPGQAPENFEDRVRRMVLLNGSVPEDGNLHTNSPPRVRLPPAPMQYQRPPAIPPYGPPHQRQQSWQNASPSSPVSPFPGAPFNQGFQGQVNPQIYQPPPPQMGSLPPHLRQPSNSQPNFQARPQQHMQHPNPGYQGQGAPRGRGPSRQQRHQQIQLDPEAFRRGGPVQNHARTAPNSRHLFDPNARQTPQPWMRIENRQLAAQYLDQVAAREVSNVDMTQAERNDKEGFRKDLEAICGEVCDANPNLPKVSLECFGSFQSGFASAGSDMDLAIVIQDQSSNAACFSMLEDDLPRALEKKLLQKGHGARLLTRTRVPIIKVCQDPGPCLLSKLQVEREKWDFLPNEKKYPHLYPNAGEDEPDAEAQPADVGSQVQKNTTITTEAAEGPTSVKAEETTTPNGHSTPSNAADSTATNTETTVVAQTSNQDAPKQARGQTQTQAWTRERKAGPLDFPKDGVGIQCDVNFFNPLGLHNTQMLRCYSLCDPRVRPMVLFVKAWAKLRRINSSYSGTLSSYGFVMMVLHYLMNVAQPPVLPNLQLPWRPNQSCTPHGATQTEVDGWVVDFWGNEAEIQGAARDGQITPNTESIGSLLAGFFLYYSSLGSGPQFRWVNWVISLRTPGGILTKDTKGWVKATTEEGEGKRIQHRYLFCIEDPFELSHNVARTVTHNGIVAIRDEFRRAHRILDSISKGIAPREGELFSKLVEAQDFIDATAALKIADEAKGKAEVMMKRQEQSKANGQAKQARRQVDGAADRPGSQGPNAPKAKAKTLDVADQNVFPSLGDASKVTSKGKKSNGEGEGFSTIDGDKAKAYLEDYRRKKAEAEAEHTAMGAAEAVLNDDD